MNKLLYDSMPCTLWWAVALLCLGSCSGNMDNATIVEINDIGTSPLHPEDLSVYASTFSLDRDSVLLGEVKDIAYGDSSFYLLDESGVLAKFPLDESKPVITKKNIGMGSGEYVMATDIEVRLDTLYVMDFPRGNIIKYDLNFNHIGDIRLGLPSSNFVVMPDGVLVENIDTKSNPNRLLSYRYDGIEVAKFLDDGSPAELPEFIPANMGFQNLNDSIIVFDNKYSTLYSINFNRIAPILQFDFVGKSLPEGESLSMNNYSEYPVLTHGFKLHEGVLLSLIYNDKRVYCYYDSNTNKTIIGTLMSTVNGKPFYPRWFLNNQLVGYNDESSGANGELLLYTLEFPD